MRGDKEKAFDAYLVAAARAGDRQALEELSRRWHGRLLAHACRLSGNPDHADDITQDAWSEILRGLPGLDSAEAFPAWAYRIVTRRCTRSIRTRLRRSAGEAASAQDPCLPTTAISEQETQTDIERIQRAMRKLPSVQSATAALFYVEGLRVAEIAVAMNVPTGTVKTRLMHARNTLRRQFNGEPA